MEKTSVPLDGFAVKAPLAEVDTKAPADWGNYTKVGFLALANQPLWLG
jgi:hypothetical protein